MNEKQQRGIRACAKDSRLKKKKTTILIAEALHKNIHWNRNQLVNNSREFNLHNFLFTLYINIKDQYNYKDINQYKVKLIEWLCHY